MVLQKSNISFPVLGIPNLVVRMFGCLQFLGNNTKDKQLSESDFIKTAKITVHIE